MTLSAMGLALTPAGGSVCMRLKSRINLLRAAVDIVVVSPLSTSAQVTVSLPRLQYLDVLFVPTIDSRSV